MSGLDASPYKVGLEQLLRRYGANMMQRLPDVHCGMT
jgi:hypothetical protein